MNVMSDLISGALLGVLVTLILGTIIFVVLYGFNDATPSSIVATTSDGGYIVKCDNGTKTLVYMEDHS